MVVMEGGCPKKEGGIIGKAKCPRNMPGGIFPEKNVLHSVGT